MSQFPDGDYYDGTIYFRCNLEDLQLSPEAGPHYVLEIENGFLQYIDVYLFRDTEWNPPIREFHAGSSRRWLKTDSETRIPSMRLTDLPEKGILLIGIRSQTRMRLPAYLYPEIDFRQYHRYQILFLTLFYGALMILFCANALGYAGLGDRSYLELNGFILVFGLFQTYIDQFWPAGPGGPSTIFFQLLILTGPLGAIALAYFMRGFLLRQRDYPLLRWTLWITMASAVAVGLVGLLSYRIAILAMLYISPLWLILLFAASIIAWRYHIEYSSHLFWALALSLPIPIILSSAGAVSAIDSLLNFSLTRLTAIPGALILTASVTRRLASNARTRQEGLEAAVRERTRQLMAESLRSDEAGKIKDNVLRIVSHDIRSPLAALKTNLPLLRRPGLPAEMRDALVTDMESTVDQLLHLSNWLLESSRAGTGKPGLEPRWTNLRGLLQEAADRFEATGRTSGVSLHVQAPADWEFLVDPPLFSSMVSNLLSNAIAHMPEGGQIRMLATLEDHLAIRISDTGSGIPLEKQSGLFDPGKGPTDPGGSPFRGRGLGLILSREIALLHGGDLMLESSGPGHTVFLFSLPRNRLYLPGSESKGHSIILIVDDDPSFRQILRSILYQVAPEIAAVEASNTTQALRILRDLTPRLILTDLWMPDEDGFHLIQSLQGDERFSRIPIWAMSADPETRTRVLKYPNVHLYISKPVSPDKMRKEFSAVFRGSRR
ncbi:MAG: response regulator [Leptospiraceae bacterium]|nr:response regulator [Leptospiraceae bacterium]MCB1304547.1 response regulator [Leptospiraceae bacterium]